MYEFFEGRVAGRGPTRLVLDVGGVGYDFAVPVGAHFADDRDVRVWTQLVVRDDAHLLFGFPDRETRDLFRLLLSVRGVGPNMALAVLSGLPREDLLAAIVAGDSSHLTKVKGVGRKTAEQILLDLGDKAQALTAGAAGASVPGTSSAQDQAIEDAIGALVSIGYSEKEARKQVDRAAKKTDTLELEELVRTALMN